MEAKDKVVFGVIGVFLSMVILMSISEFFYPQVLIPHSLHTIVDVAAIIGVGVGIIWIIQSRKEKN